MGKYNRRIIINFILSMAFLILMALVAIKYMPYIMDKIRSLEGFRSYLLSFGNASIGVFIMFQVIQVIIAVIPGEIVQVAGGYVYGTLLGTLFSLIGIVLGSIVVFFISRLVGYTLVKKIVSKSVIDKFEFMMNSKRAEIVIFILFLIPGLPKDMLTYLAGFSPIHALSFFAIITVARLPGILVSAYIGANLQEQQYILVAVISTAVVVITLLAVLYREKIISRLKIHSHVK